MADAAALIMEVHGRVLSFACTSLDQHYEGLAKIARVLAQRNMIDGSMKKTLLNLDTAAAFVRHITQPKNDMLLNKLEQILTSATPTVTDTAPTPVIENVALAPDVTCTALSLHAPVKEHMALAPGVSDDGPVPVIESMAYAPAVTNTAPALVIEIVAPTPAVTSATPAPVIEHVMVRVKQLGSWIGNDVHFWFRRICAKFARFFDVLTMLLIHPSMGWPRLPSPMQRLPQ